MAPVVEQIGEAKPDLPKPTETKGKQSEVGSTLTLSPTSQFSCPSMTRLFQEPATTEKTAKVTKVTVTKSKKSAAVKEPQVRQCVAFTYDNLLYRTYPFLPWSQFPCCQYCYTQSSVSLS